MRNLSADDCIIGYPKDQVLAWAFHHEVTSHIDLEMAKKVEYDLDYSA
jgi:hypothetical protein